MDKLVDGIVLNRRETEGYAEDFEDIEFDYSTTDKLDDMDSFLIRYTGFVDKINARLSPSDTIVLYAVYINTTRD